jgi:hypothetical protein
MKNSGSVIQGFCAGALAILIVLAFAVGSSVGGRPRQAESASSSASSNEIAIIFYPTMTPTPQRVAAVDLPAVRMSIPDPESAVQSAGVKSSQPTPTPAPTLDHSCFQSMAVGASFERESAMSLGCATTVTLSAVFTTTEICPILRDSCAFGHLVGNLDPGIIFERNEPPPRDDEDQLMHPAMLRPLARLRDKVLKHWSGQRTLVVKQAYDSSPMPTTGETGLDPGLGFQGQLVAVSLSPQTDQFEVDIGELCGLALSSGFDWVGREQELCRAAVKAPRLCDVCRATAAPTPTATSELTPTAIVTTTAVIETPTAEPSPAPTGSPP